MPLTEGHEAPDFELPDDTGTLRRLSNYRGQIVVLYFYPKDDTPGCTAEACNFRDDYSAYSKSDAVILGVSPDDMKAHTQFKKKYDLPFPLLVDTDHRICELYGVWGPKEYMGRSYDGVFRTTYLIDKNGFIFRSFENVRPSEHSTEVLEAIKEYQVSQ